MSNIKESIRKFYSIYPKEKSSVNYANLWRWIVVNPISIMCAYLISFLKIQPNTVTLFSLLTGLVGIYYFFICEFLIGALIINLAYLFDCIDGHLARFYNKTSKNGKYLDDIVGIIIWSFSWIAIGFGLYENSDSSLESILNIFNVANFDEKYYILFGIVAGYTSELRSLIATKFNESYIQKFQEQNIIDKNNKYSDYGFTYVFFRNILGIGGFIAPLLIVSAYFNFMSLTLALYCFIFLFVFVFYCFRYYFKISQS